MHGRNTHFARRVDLSQAFPLVMSGKSPLEARPSRARKEGRIAIVTDVGRGMRWTLWAAQDERGPSVRRNRVVLISRRWDQVLKKLTLLRNDGG
jgi:hypothetical protein